MMTLALSIILELHILTTLESSFTSYLYMFIVQATGAFVPRKPNLIFAGKIVSLPWSGAPGRYFIRVGKGLTHNIRLDCKVRT